MWAAARPNCSAGGDCLAVLDRLGEYGKSRNSWPERLLLNWKLPAVENLSVEGKLSRFQTQEHQTGHDSRDHRGRQGNDLRNAKVLPHHKLILAYEKHRAAYLLMRIHDVHSITQRRGCS